MGLNQKSKKTDLWSATWRTDVQKNGSIPSINKKEEAI